MITIPQTVADTIEAVRVEDRCSMLDRFCVQAVSLGMGDEATVTWIDDHYWDYGAAILHGYEVEEYEPRL